jgi:hypothetical protein
VSPRLTILAVLVAATLPARAETIDAITLEYDGCDTVADPTAVLAVLKLELASSDLPPVRVDATAPHALPVLVRCAPSRSEVVLVVGKHQPYALPFADTPPAMRSRTLALSIAETVRRSQLEIPEAPAETPLDVLKPPSAATLPEAAVHPIEGAFRNEERLRLSRTATIALSAITLVGFAVGSPIAAVGDAHQNRSDLRGAGAVILGLSCGPLIGTGVGLGFWLHERSLPVRPATTP